EARGLRIVHEGYGDNMSGVRPFNWSPGTTLAVLLHRPAGNLVEVDLDASSVESFTDDRNTNLLKKNERSWGRTGFGPFARLSEDGKAAMVEIAGDSLPAANATTLTAKGTITLVTARGQETVKAGDVKFAKDESFQIGDVSFTVESAKASEWQDDVYEVTFRSTDNLDDIAGLKFEADGKTIDARRGATSRSGMGENITTRWTYSFKEKLDAASVAADVWVELESHDVPFELEVGLGLSGEGDEKD
ncbi:MAG: hypothetical protein ACOC3G_06190, partial [Phycisphaeraceae bacterium]